MPGAFKLDHLQHIKPIFFQKIFNFSTFILGGQFLLPHRDINGKVLLFVASSLRVSLRASRRKPYRVVRSSISPFLSVRSSSAFATLPREQAASSPTLFIILRGDSQSRTKGQPREGERPRGRAERANDRKERARDKDAKMDGRMDETEEGEAVLGWRRLSKVEWVGGGWRRRWGVLRAARCGGGARLGGAQVPVSLEGAMRIQHAACRARMLGGQGLDT